MNKIKNGLKKWKEKKVISSKLLPNVLEDSNYHKITVNSPKADDLLIIFYQYALTIGLCELTYNRIIS